MLFKTEYQLQEFRDIQHEHFDDKGEVYSGLGREHSLCEQMLKLINQLEAEIKNSMACVKCHSIKHINEFATPDECNECFNA